MTIEVILPKLSLAMEEGTIVRWLKRVGDPVKPGEILFEVETDKSILEVEAAAGGILSEILVEEGQSAPVAAAIARIRTAGEDLDQEATPPAPPVEARVPAVRSTASEPDRPQEASAQPAANPDRPEVPENPRQFISWRARRIARENNLDLSRLPPGSGPQGRIIERDVAAVLAARQAEDGGEWLEPSTVQRITAERMAHSFSTTPHFYLTVEVDAENLLALREAKLPEVEASQGVRLTVTDLLVKLAALAVGEHPRANASWIDGRIRVNREIHIGLAAAAPQGLLVPVIRHADRKSLAEIASERARLVAKVQGNKLQPDEMSGASFTLTNLGMFGIDQFQAIINPPQSVILAVGRIKDRPVGHNGQVVLKPVFYLSLSCDHRVLDGVTGAAFLQRVVELIENPVL